MTLSQIGTEAAIGSVIYSGIVYGVYVLVDDDSDAQFGGDPAAG